MKTLMSRALSMLRVRADEKGRENVLTFRGVTEAVASDDGVLLVDGADFTRFDRNPVVLWRHGYDAQPIIGRVVEHRTILADRAIDFDIEFAVGIEPMADRAKRLADAGFLRGASIGFRVTQMNHSPTEQERDQYGLAKFGWIGVKWELHELSLVPVPSDPDALKRAIESGDIEQADADVLPRSDADRDIVSTLREIADEIKAACAASSQSMTQLRDAIDELHVFMREADAGGGDETPTSPSEPGPSAEVTRALDALVRVLNREKSNG